MMKTLLITLVTICFSIASIGAQNAKNFPLPKGEGSNLGMIFNSADLKELEQNGSLFKSLDQAKTSSFNLPPGILQAVNNFLASKKPDMFLEQIKIFPLPSKYVDKLPETQLAVYNTLHSFSTMSGIEYFSASRKEMRVLFTKSGVINSKDNKSYIPDPKFTSVREQNSLLIDQDDSTFGDNIYRVQIRNDQKFTHLNMTNEDQIWYGIVPVLEGKALNLDLAIIYSSKYIVFYSSAAFSPPRIFGIDEKAKTSFQNRLDSLFNWFIRQFAKS